jgi:hypothetical protein
MIIRSFMCGIFCVVSCMASRELVPARDTVLRDSAMLKVISSFLCPAKTAQAVRLPAVVKETLAYTYVNRKLRTAIIELATELFSGKHSRLYVIMSYGNNKVSFIKILEHFVKSYQTQSKLDLKKELFAVDKVTQRSPLTLAVQDTKMLQYLQQESLWSLNEVDGHGHNLLLSCVSHEALGALAFLIPHIKTQPTVLQVRDRTGANALIMAADQGNVSLLIILLKAQIFDVNLKNKEKANALHVALNKYTRSMEEWAEESKSEDPNIEAEKHRQKYGNIMQLLLEHKINADDKNMFGQTALQICICHCVKETIFFEETKHLIEQLHKAGADFNQTDKFDQTLLDLADSLPELTGMLKELTSGESDNPS